MKSFKQFVEGGKKTVVFDVENVLLDFSTLIISLLKRDNVKFTTSNYDFGLDEKTVYKYVEEIWNSPNFENMPIIKDAKQVFNKISALVPTAIATAIPFKYKIPRIKNLKGFNYQALHFYPKDKSGNVIKNLSPDICVEDKPENIEDFHNSGAFVYYPNLPYIPNYNFGYRYSSMLDLWSHIKNKL
jgi:hypothetical protein